MVTLQLLDLIPPASLSVATDPPPLGPGQAQIIVPRSNAAEKAERRRAIQYRRLGGDLEQAKAFFLRVYQSTGDFAMACAAAGRHHATIETWSRKDPVFKERREELAAVWRALLDTNFKALGVKALETVEVILESDAADPALRAKLAQWILKSQSVGVEKTATLGIEHSGPGGGPIPVRQVIVHLSGAAVNQIEEPARAREGAGVLDADYEYVNEDGEDER